MHITTDIPDELDAMRALAYGFVLVNILLIKAGVVPPFPHDVPGLVYAKEPPGEEDWTLAHLMMKKGCGDCEDLVFWTVAGLWYTGEDPDARLDVIKTGPRTLHAVVRRGDGSIEDPTLDFISEGRARDGVCKVQR